MADTVEIIPDGDVFLIVGSEKKRFRVNIAQLGAASPVFKRMFERGRYAEGQNLSITAPKDVPLPDDDPSCIEMFANIVHFNNDVVPTSVKPGFLKSFAIMVDKYACHNSGALALQIWFEQMKGSGQCSGKADEMLSVLEAMYIMRQAESFKQMTRSVMLQLAPTDILAGLTKTDNLPAGLLASLSTRMIEVRATAATSIESKVQGIFDLQHNAQHSLSCRRACAYLCRAQQRLGEAGLWPTGTLPADVQTLAKKLTAVEHIDTSDLQILHCSGGGGSYGCCTKTRFSNADLRALATKILDMCSGRCLVCVTQGDVGFAGPCKH